MTDPRAKYAAEAARYDTRWAAYNRATLEMLRPHLTARPPGRLLDLGCGTANLALMLAGWGVRPELYLGVDPVPEMLRVAADKLRDVPPSFPARLAAGEAGTLPVREAAFDTVVSASNLHYWPDPARGLDRVRAALRPGGRFLVVDWSRDTLRMKLRDRWLRLLGDRYHRVYTADECAGHLRAAGLRVRALGRRGIPGGWEMLVAEAER
ncbi:MAG TPA: class I SAM-dependent methyltransferase [Longimicrobiaceae bacterium]|nr:class I SAM-dependent methyltransferase [Longimicrobiaceae bacterium]